ncbi:ABC transporter ATP-binding protein [Pseudonocardia kunmingensis]|uniref:NitT/TauT family transport system ATP-binding protein n=1 Tax=Pseudonocardia kunmingensis TaxID=630975 RepID=A0A543DQK3_9PSEU|nr:ABC transporter ATP-binding protein [Pseudonocardia kunmingensis]TQM11596.1 NitT/TauT family transport system ATP-binding protein [Pseudonocardia kunmingensis]
MSASTLRQSDVPEPGSPDPREPLISISNLGVRYDGGRRGRTVVAIENVDLDVYAGEFLTVLGPSGCGKTTMMNTVAGIVRATEGSVRVDGVPVTGPGPDRAVVFQDYALMPWRTVAANVRFGMEMQPRLRDRDADAQVREAIELVGLRGFENSYPRQLSGGMQQRVGLARALVAEPRIMLMDEPLGAVDALTREVMRGELERIIAATGKTVMFITHSIEEAILLGDRVAVFSSHPGSIAEVLEVELPRPRSERSAAADPRYVELRNHLWTLLETDARNAATEIR